MEANIPLAAWTEGQVVADKSSEGSDRIFWVSTFEIRSLFKQD